MSTINHYEITQISDALRIHKYERGDKIIQQGEQGDVFYILEEGTACAIRDFNDGSKLKLIYKKMVHKESKTTLKAHSLAN